MKTVFVVGFENVGKTTFARLLEELGGFREVAFADLLKESAYATNPFVEGGVFLADVVDELGWERAKDEVPGVRRYLEDFANKGIKDLFGQHFWADQVLNNIKDNPQTHWVVSDLRFHEEHQRAIELLGEENVYTIKILRGETPTQLRRSQKFASEHEANYTINNNGELENLKEHAKRITQELLTST